MTRPARRGMLAGVATTSLGEPMILCRAAALCVIADEASHGAGMDRTIGIGRRAA